MSDEPRCIAIDPPPAAQAREAEVTHLLEALRHELPAEQYARVHALHILTDDAATDRATHWQDHLIECLMAHFPGFAPAIRAVAAHVGEHVAHPDCCARARPIQPLTYTVICTRRHPHPPAE